MKNVILASTSALYGGGYLEYLVDEIKGLFTGVDEIIFIPFARAGGLSHEEYTGKAASFFAGVNIRVKGLHEFDDKGSAIKNAQGIFTGGGNTFLLVKQLHDAKLMEVLKSVIEKGTPYLGTSAGSNIGGINMCTTNDMPIVYPPSFECIGLMPYNLNPHYLDPDPNSQHNGETRETRIREFQTLNDINVLGLREGNWIRIKGEKSTVEGPHLTRLFRPGQEPVELEPETVI